MSEAGDAATDAHTPAKPVSKEVSADERARRLRAAELLGDVMPTATRDDTDEGWGERAASSRDDEMLRDVPPHHG